MSLRLLYNSSQESQFLHRIEVPISYSALFFRVTGTNDTGVAAAAREVGRIRFSIRQQPIIDADFDYLQALQALWYGTSEFASATAGAFAASVMIPRAFLGDTNVERVTKSDAAIFETNFTPGLFSDIASGFLAELYAVVAEGPQTYNLLMHQQTQPTVAAGQVYPDDISTVENVCAAYLSDIVSSVLTLAGSNINRVRVRKGDVDTDSQIAASQAYTAAVYRREGVTVANEPIIEIFGLAGSDLSARLEDTYKLTVQTGTGGTASPQILTIGFKPNPDRLAESAGEIRSRLDRAKRQKAATNKTRALQVINTVTGGNRFGA